MRNVPIRFNADADDARDIHAAVAYYQRTRRWDDAQGGVLLPEGDSDLMGAVLGEICRGWLESQEALQQEGDGDADDTGR